MIFSPLGSKWPVNQEAIDIIQTKVFQGIVETPLYILGLRKMYPDLCCNEYIFSLDC